MPYHILVTTCASVAEYFRMFTLVILPGHFNWIDPQTAFMLSYALAYPLTENIYNRLNSLHLYQFGKSVCFLSGLRPLLAFNIPKPHYRKFSGYLHLFL